MAKRPSIASPTYGSLTGNINWSRGAGELLAQAPQAVSPPIARPATTSPSSANTAGSGFRAGLGRFSGGGYINRNGIRTYLE